MLQNHKIITIILIALLGLTGCISTDNKEVTQSLNKSIQKDQFLLSQAIDLNKKGEYENANAILNELAKSGMPEAQSLLGKAHHLGLGTPKSPQKAEYWYKLAVSQNYTISIYLLSSLYKENGDMEGYNLYLKRAVMLDLNIATEMLSLQLFLDKNKVGLIEWNENTKGNKNNYLFENYLLELLIDESKIANNDKELLIWLKLLADKGNALAQYNYGMAYINSNYGIVGNLKTAKYWLKLAATSRNIIAQRELGLINFKEGNYIEAYMWFMLYSEINTLESLKLRTLSLSKLSQEEINKANQMLNDIIQEKINKINKQK